MPVINTLAQLSLICLVCSPLSQGQDQLLQYHASPKLTRVAQLAHEPQDEVLNSLDAALQRVSAIYTQAILAGTYTIEFDMSLHTLELELFELLERLYKQHRLKDYMRYEAEVTRQMITYNMLKSLFGYAQESDSPA